MIIKDIIINLSFLIVSTYLYGLNLKYLHGNPVRQKIVSGSIFGAISILSMVFSFEMSSGLIFDGRSIILSLAAFFGGFLGAIISAIIALIYRLLLGGEGQITGALVILTSSTFGLLVYILLKRGHKILKLYQVFIFGLVVHLVAILLFYITIPGEHALIAVKNLWKAFIFLFPVVTVFIYYIFTDREKRIKEEREFLQSQRKLADSENKFRTAFEQSASGMCLTSIDGIILQVNAPFCDLLGYSKNEIEGINYNQITFDGDQHIGHEFVQKMLQNEIQRVSFEKRYLTKKKEIIWVQINSALVRDADSKPLHFITQIENITFRKYANEKLRESEERFRRVFEDGSLGMAMANLSDGLFISVNNALCQMLGYTQEELCKLSFQDISHPDYLEADRHAFQEIRKGKKQHQQNEKRYLKKNGDLIWASQSLSNIHSTDGDSFCALAMMEDITERKKAEEALRHSVEKHRSILQTAMDGFWIVDMQGFLLEVNNTYCSMSGYTEKELLTMNISDLEAPGNNEKTLVHIKKLEAYGENRFETKHRRKDGSCFDIEIRMQNRFAEDGHCVVFLKDITQSKKSQEEIKKLNEELEKRVEERTQTLEDKLLEIERMNKLFVGRELRMIELKEVIANLEEKVKRIK